MHSTLDVIRTKGYSHNNDVSPKNILVKIGSSQCQAFLIDFGISSTTKVALTGYRGTPCYSPLFVIMKYPQAQWKPDKFVDLLALALSIAWVVEPEKIHGHPFSHVHLQEQMARGKKLKLGLKNVLNLHPNSWTNWLLTVLIGSVAHWKSQSNIFDKLGESSIYNCPHPFIARIL